MSEVNLTEALLRAQTELVMVFIENVNYILKEKLAEKDYAITANSLEFHDKVFRQNLEREVAYFQRYAQYFQEKLVFDKAQENMLKTFYEMKIGSYPLLNPKGTQIVPDDFQQKNC